MMSKRLALLGAALFCGSTYAVVNDGFEQVRGQLVSIEQATDSDTLVGVNSSEFTSLLGAVNPVYSASFDPSQLDANDQAIAAELVNLKTYMGAQDDAWLDAAVRDAASENTEAKGRLDVYVGDVFRALPAMVKSKISDHRQMYQQEDASRLGVYFNEPGDDVLGVSPEITKMTAEVERLIAYESAPPEPAVECRYDSGYYYSWYLDATTAAGTTYIDASWGVISHVDSGDDLLPGAFIEGQYKYYHAGPQKTNHGSYKVYEICRESSAPAPKRFTFDYVIFKEKICESADGAGYQSCRFDDPVYVRPYTWDGAQWVEPEHPKDDNGQPISNGSFVDINPPSEWSAKYGFGEIVIPNPL
ncbi:hypothetical protein ACP3V3_16880 [Vibrio sp. PNB22_3_1]